MAVFEAGADDVRSVGESFEITCAPGVFQKVQETLQKAGLTLDSAEVTHIPKDPMTVDIETGQKIARLLEALDDHEDVQNVFSNASLTEEMMTQ